MPCTPTSSSAESSRRIHRSSEGADAKPCSRRRTSERMLLMHRDTAILHAGYRPPADEGPFLGGPQFSSTYAARGEPSRHALTYGRFQNPTWAAWEEALGVLEGGQA